MLPTLEQEFERVSKEQATNFLTLSLILIDKGIITEENWNKAKQQATEQVEQMWKEKKKNKLKRFKNSIQN
jgi:hypothetical protein